MSAVRKFTVSLLLKALICLALLLFVWIFYKTAPQYFSAFRQKLFYTVDLGEIFRELKALGRCVLPF